MGRRASYDRILIVSEGSKTEPLYFAEIRAEHRLHSANVQVHPSAIGTQSRQVVEYARDLFNNGDRYKSIQPRAFEQVYAVFDRDDHRTYFDALSLAKSLDRTLRNDTRQPIRFKAIASVPCFELWLLLHFEEVHHPLHRDEALARTKRHISGYTKGSRGCFMKTKDRLDLAIARAQKLANRYNEFDGVEPFTGVAELVSVLTRLRG